MATNLGFIYIKLNPDYTYYFKGGYTECPERSFFVNLKIK